MFDRVTSPRARAARTRALVLTPVLVGISAVGAYAQASGSFIGHTYKVESRERPDGLIAQVFWYAQGFTGPADSSDPLANNAADCMGVMIVTADGATRSGSGSCHIQTADGASGASGWWKVTAAGTAECSAVCGEYGLYGGYGDYEGATGGGTWVRSAVFPNGMSIGTWQAN